PQSQTADQNFTFNMRFPGQYLDKETGTLYNYYRTYNPATGRYLQSDPIGLNGGTNTYGYVEANSLSKSDPKGLYSWSDVPEAWDHYCDGTGTNWYTGFGSLNWGDTEASIGEKIKAMVGGNCKDTTIPVEFTSPGQTAGADAWIVGRHSVATRGSIQLNCDCSWKFSGDMSSARGHDPYDFDASNRGVVAETATAVGRASCKTRAKPFKIFITGSKALSLGGKINGQSKCCEK
ncbi:MAG: hypothetical protein EOP38_28390, partial [Rubrivivax sp.]